MPEVATGGERKCWWWWQLVAGQGHTHRAIWRAKEALRSSPTTQLINKWIPDGYLLVHYLFSYKKYLPCANTECQIVLSYVRNLNSICRWRRWDGSAVLAIYIPDNVGNGCDSNEWGRRRRLGQSLCGWEVDGQLMSRRIFGAWLEYDYAIISICEWGRLLWTHLWRLLSLLLMGDHLVSKFNYLPKSVCIWMNSMACWIKYKL